MKRLREAIEADEQELIWCQPDTWKSGYELCAGDEVVATLRLPKLWGSLAEAESADGRWTFKRVGFWRQRVTIRNAGEEADLGTFDPRWTGEGTLRIGDVYYQWDATSFWKQTFVWRDHLGQELMAFASTNALTKSEAKLEISPAGRELQHSSLLALFGWYLVVKSIQDSVAATTAATSGAVASSS